MRGVNIATIPNTEYQLEMYPSLDKTTISTSDFINWLNDKGYLEIGFEKTLLMRHYESNPEIIDGQFSISLSGAVIKVYRSAVQNYTITVITNTDGIYVYKVRTGDPSHWSRLSTDQEDTLPVNAKRLITGRVIQSRNILDLDAGTDPGITYFQELDPVSCEGIPNSHNGWVNGVVGMKLHGNGTMAKLFVCKDGLYFNYSTDTAKDTTWKKLAFEE